MKDVIFIFYLFRLICYNIIFTDVNNYNSYSIHFIV